MANMKVLMLGWEYPPHIAGGLGTACEGLTRALARLNMDITFVMPQVHGDEPADHMVITDHMIDADYEESHSEGFYDNQDGSSFPDGETGIERIPIETFLMPYWTEASYKKFVESQPIVYSEVSDNPEDEVLASKPRLHKRQDIYGGDIFQQVAKFTRRVIRESIKLDFDVIHAHDWMTFPAAKAIQQITGKPLACHVHSLEYDRSGKGVNPRIRDIERLGVEAATRVITVSHYTKGIISQEYSVPENKISVVHNGIYTREAFTHYKHEDNDGAHSIVLFIGRVTFQKGPEYFVRAAQKVIPHVPNVLFVLAGSGDMLEPIKQMVNEMGLSDYFEFPGFVRGKNVEKYYSIADMYVMPSVSEPFGLTALEAVDFGTPALISRQSGASEVLGNTLKFDFWDVDRLSDLIMNALLHPEMRKEMARMARKELGGLRWDAAATKCVEIYNELTSSKGVTS